MNPPTGIIRTDSNKLSLQVSSGAVWSFGGALCKAIILFGVTIILARFLDASSFGLYALGLIVIQFVNEIGELGIQQGLIQDKNLTEDKVSSCFWLTLFLRIMVTLLIFGFASFFSKIIGVLEFGGVLRILALSLAFEGLCAVPVSLLYREFRFKVVALVETSSGLAFGIIAVMLAYREMGVLSLLWAYVFESMVRSVMFILVTKFRPRVGFRLGQIEGLIRFGATITGERIINFFVQRVDYLIIGRVLGMQPLGYYSLATEISSTPHKRFSMLVGRIALPVFSKVQDDYSKLSKAYFKIVGHVASVTFPTLLCLAAVAPEFVRIVYGEKWLPMVPLLRVLCALGCLKSVTTFVGSLIYAKGRPDIGFKWSFVMLAGTSLGVIIGSQWEVLGASVGYALSYFLLVPVIQSIALRLINENIINYSRALFPAGVSSVGAAAATWGAAQVLMRYSFNSSWFVPFCALLVGAFVHLLIYFGTARENVREVWNIGRDFILGARLY